MKRNIMKKIFAVLAVVLLLVGCVKENENTNGNKTVEKVDYKKAIVIYFSRAGENYNVGTVDTGNTAMMASYVKEYLNADSFEIVPKVPYPSKYNEAKDIANKELEEKARPEILYELKNLEEYDTIFLGYPIWCNDMPMIIYTFIETYDLSGKTIIPFNTHEGSGNAGTFTKLSNILKNSNVNKKGLSLTGKTARTQKGKEQTIEWLKSLGY